jgi:O-antigen ligase/tetratricopeptide (TPR) repeat protein
MTLNVVPQLFTPIGWGKTISFRIIFSIVAFIFIFQIIFKKINLFSIKEKIKSVSGIFWLLMALFGIYLLATVFSIDPAYSLWGSPDRAGGFVNFALYIFFAIITFLIIEKKDWIKIIDFAILIGVIVAIIAVFQQFGILSKYLIPFTSRPISTIGNAILLSTYFVLLSFLPISLGIKTQKLYKKIFYFSSAVLFVLVTIILVQTRGAYLGFAFGFLWFFFAYPKKMKKTKIWVAVILIGMTLFLYSAKVFMDQHIEYYSKMPQIIENMVDRGLSVFEGTGVIKSRLSAWTVSFNAIKERPILGYGPENFTIAFDKYYDPSLPIIGPNLTGDSVQWWDKAHNFIFDTLINAGIFALFIYLFFICFILWRLNKAKKENPENSLLYSGLEATFIGYIITQFFSFDCFDTYLIFFLFVGYSMFLISDYKIKELESTEIPKQKGSYIFEKIYKLRMVILALGLIFLVYFIWVYNIKPLKANETINIASNYVSKNKCDLALEKVNTALNSKTIIDSFIKKRYAGIAFDCQSQSQNPALLAENVVNILEINAQNHPEHLQNWIALSEYYNILMEQKNKLTNNDFVPSQEMMFLKTQANSAFESAISLSPKRQMIFKDWAKLGISTADYELAEQKADACIALNENYIYCWWLKALAKSYLGDKTGFEQLLSEAKKRGFQTNDQDVLEMAANMYIKINDYKSLVEVYINLINIAPENNIAEKTAKAQLYASLATAYKEIGKIKEARESALKILELEPNAKPLVDEFLKTLK